VDGGKAWDAQGKLEGRLNPQETTDFKDRLFRFENIEASGVPSLFSHPYVVSTKLSAGDEEALKNFSNLVKGIFLGVVSTEDITANLGQLGKVAEKFKTFFNKFQILKWKGQPIGGMSPDSFVFPGARFENREWGDDLSWDNLADEVQRMESRLGSDIVRALFGKWVEEINTQWEGEVRKIFNLRGDRNLPPGVQEPLWLQKLSEVRNQWTTPVQPPPPALDEFTGGVSNFSNFAVLDGNENLVRIPIRSIKKNIFCERIIRFSNGKMPDWPIRSEYLDSIEKVSKEGDRYLITLNGWSAPITWTPREVIEVDRASILLWPNFQAAGWNVNYAFFYPSEVLKGLHPSVKLLNVREGRKGKVVREEASGEKAASKTDYPITHVEIFCDGQAAGLFADGRPQLNPSLAASGISLDFGTSNTSLSIRVGDEDQLFELQDMTVDILGMDYYLQSRDEAGIEAFKRSFWFPTYFPGRMVTTLPSDLIFVTEEIRLGGPSSLREPFKDFTIPHPLYERNGAEKCIISNFKWEEHGVFRGHREDLVKAYLKLVMHMAFATLRKNKNAGAVTLQATYPLAFDEVKYNAYKNWLSAMMAELRKETGVDVRLEFTNLARKEVELVTESEAGSALFSPPPHIAKFMVDIGGGTTDIALVKDGEILAKDSIRYAGNLYIEFLAKNLFMPGLIEDDNGENGVTEMELERRKIKLQRVVRSEGIGGLFALYAKHNAKRTIAEDTLHRFFGGLFEYLHCLLKARGLRDDVNLYPIGNGWRFIGGVDGNGDLRSYITEWFRGKGINVTVNLPNMGFKEAVALGANKIVRIGQYQHPDLKQPVQSVVGPAPIKIYWNGGGQKTFDPNVHIPVYLGCERVDNPRFDTLDFINSLPFRPARNIPNRTISDRLNTECMAEDMIVNTQHGLKLGRSIFARFLERIYPEFYL
jgi:hypothetical protein